MTSSSRLDWRLLGLAPRSRHEQTNDGHGPLGQWSLSRLVLYSCRFRHDRLCKYTIDSNSGSSQRLCLPYQAELPLPRPDVRRPYSAGAATWASVDDRAGHQTEPPGLLRTMILVLDSLCFFRLVPPQSRWPARNRDELANPYQILRFSICLVWLGREILVAIPISAYLN
ncbi:hypothetical protein VTK73DRAFT_3361 [Phialemonium thermophilum]|uniref:Uncharacterized protein n=1 Tax=Phialemonium thermophilum TaxID=223376 RepID=A0ABR3VJ09_9PEZI